MKNSRISSEYKNRIANRNTKKRLSYVQQHQQEELLMNLYPLHCNYENDHSKHGIKIGFVIVATGKYDVYIEPLIRSIETFFLDTNKKFYNIFSDKDIKLSGVDYEIFKVDHRPFPYPTLYRFHFFEQYKDSIIGDQIIYIDADTLITSKIGTEVITPITATQHCGFVNRWGSFENRQESKCCVSRAEGRNYYGGGFYSFSRNEFFRLCHFGKETVDWEAARGRTPIWHDESVLNKYLTLAQPTRVLSPSYHYPENNQTIYSTWGGNKFDCKILLLNKNHKEMRQ